MKIELVEAMNFKGVKKMSFKPGKINILLGSNASGKSSMLQAIRFGLTGNYPPDPIAGDADKAVVEITFPEIGILKRTLSATKNEVRLNNKITTQKSITNLLADQSGVSPETANLLTSTELLEEMKGGELSAYFLDNNLLKGEISSDTLTSYCDLTDAAIDTLKRELGSDIIAMEAIEQVWNEAKGKRKMLKQQLKEAEIRSQDIGQTLEYTAEDLEAELAQLLKRQGELQAEQKNYNRILEQKNKVLRDIQEREQRLTKQNVEPREEDIAQCDSELQRTYQEILNIKGIITTLIETGKSLKHVLSELERSTCPISEKLICKTDKSSVKKELQESFDNANVEYKKQKKHMDELVIHYNNLQKKKNEMNEQRTVYQRQALLREQISYLKENLPILPEKPETQTFNDITGRITKLNLQRALLIKQLEAEEQKSRKTSLEKEVKIYEEIVRELDPKKGIRQKILSHSIAPLEKFLNQQLESILPKYTARIDCTKGISIKLCKDGKEYDSNDSASTGEACRIKFALMNLINALSPYRILIFDGTDGMDEKGMITLIRMLSSEELRKHYDHVFVPMIDYKEVVQELERNEEFNILHFDAAEPGLLAA